jgi:RNA polymerase sigma-70 factor (ECF subfamily)
MVRSGVVAMDSSDTTCWTVLRDAAAGAQAARDQFAERYGPLVRAYLVARWRGTPLAQDVEDAVQEVFVECLRQGGVLERAEPNRPGGFRAFLYGVVRNVALRGEQVKARRKEHAVGGDSHPELREPTEESLSHVFDRAWAKSVMREAAARQAEQAERDGSAAQKRVELLRLRFQDGLPIREVARLWKTDAAVLHHEYARARAEFREALVEIMSYYHPGSPAEVERECKELLALLE